MSLERMEGSAQSEWEHCGIYDQTLSDGVTIGKSQWYTTVYFNVTLFAQQTVSKRCLQEYNCFTSPSCVSHNANFDILLRLLQKTKHWW